MNKKTLEDLGRGDLESRRVLVRVDFNVPLAEGGGVGDATRIRRTVPTLRYLLERGARIILCSHLGRPAGRPDSGLSLEPVARVLAELVGVEVTFCTELVGDSVTRAVDGLKAGQILLLENTRFHPGEKSNDAELSRALAAIADVYVNDAFGTAHRAHASTEGVARALRERGGEAVAGLLMARELHFLRSRLENPERPYVAVLGGAKISGKIDVMEALLPRVDTLLVGGAMANTFFRALGLETGRSLVEEERVGMALDVLDAAGSKLILPVDVVVTDELKEGGRADPKERGAVGSEDIIVDAGPASRDLFARALSGAKTVIWNGPMGVFEMPPFDAGTRAVAQAVAAAADRGALTVLGGGDSAAAAREAGVADRLSHVSTGGGASLELLSGAALPGVEALSEA